MPKETIESKLYKFRCRDGHDNFQWTYSDPHSDCPKCGKLIQNFGRIN